MSTSRLDQDKAQLRAGVYARLSETYDAAESVPTQLERGEAHAARQGWRVAARFKDDGYSGFKEITRDGFGDLIGAIESGQVDVVIVRDVDRLTRNLTDWNRFEKACVRHGVLLSPYTGADLDLSTPEGAYYGGMETLRAKRESAVKSARAREAADRNAWAGKRAGGGWRCSALPGSTPTLMSLITATGRLRDPPQRRGKGTPGQRSGGIPARGFSPATVAWLAARHAEVSAALGDSTQALRSWAQAAQAREICDPEEDRVWTRFLDQNRFDFFQISTLAGIGKLDDAQKVARAVISRISQSDRKKAVIILGDIASASLAQGVVSGTPRLWCTPSFV